jgi:hypothetical protein
MKTGLIWITAPALALAAFAGCLDETANDSMDTLAPALARTPQRHCNIAVTALRDGKPVAGAPAAEECFDSFSDAMFAATRGALRLAPDATPETFHQLSADKIAAAATYLLSIEYVAPRWDAFWGTRNFTSSIGSCDTSGLSFSYDDLRTTGFNDVISSVFTQPGCAHGFHYEHANGGGARLDCYPASPGIGDPCYYGLGALDDRSSSIRWTNSPL